MLSRVGGKEASIGVPGPALCRYPAPVRATLRTMPYRARCLALFSPRKGAWHRSHRVSTGSCRPPASHRRGRNPSNSPPTPPPPWGDAGTPKADRKAGAVETAAATGAGTGAASTGRDDDMATTGCCHLPPSLTATPRERPSTAGPAAADCRWHQTLRPTFRRERCARSGDGQALSRRRKSAMSKAVP